MKKGTGILAIAAVIAVSTAAAPFSYAKTIQPEKTDLEQKISDKLSMKASDFVDFSGVISNVTKNKENVSVIVDDVKSGQKMVFVVTERVSIYQLSTGNPFGISDLKKGDEVKGYYHKDTIMPMIYPAQVESDFLFVNDPQKKQLGEVKIGKFKSNFTSKDELLKLNISKKTQIVNERGQNINKEDLLGKELIVFYSVTTRSIPAQTTPYKIIGIENRKIINEKYQFVFHIPSSWRGSYLVSEFEESIESPIKYQISFRFYPKGFESDIAQDVVKLFVIDKSKFDKSFINDGFTKVFENDSYVYATRNVSLNIYGDGKIGKLFEDMSSELKNIDTLFVPYPQYIDEEISKIIETESFMEKGVRMVSLKEVADLLGYEKEWYKNNVLLRKGNKTFSITLGKKEYGFNRSIRYFETPAMLKNDKVYIQEDFIKILR